MVRVSALAVKGVDQETSECRGEEIEHEDGDYLCGGFRGPGVEALHLCIISRKGLRAFHKTDTSVDQFNDNLPGACDRDTLIDDVLSKLKVCKSHHDTCARHYQC